MQCLHGETPWMALVNLKCSWAKRRDSNSSVLHCQWLLLAQAFFLSSFLTVHPRINGRYTPAKNNNNKKQNKQKTKNPRNSQKLVIIVPFEFSRPCSIIVFVVLSKPDKLWHLFCFFFLLLIFFSGSFTLITITIKMISLLNTSLDRF